MLGKLAQFKKFPAQYSENGHASSLRSSSTFIIDIDVEALGIGATNEVRFLTGDKAVIFEGGELFINQEDVLFEIFEDTTYSAPGVANLDYSRNLNRLINRTTEVLFYDGPTITDDGEVVLHQHILGSPGQNVNQPGFGAGGQDKGAVLKPNTEHLFRITNGSVLAVHVESHLFYREINFREYDQA